jgi:plastocyanin
VCKIGVPLITVMALCGCGSSASAPLVDSVSPETHRADGPGADRARHDAATADARRSDAAERADASSGVCPSTYADCASFTDGTASSPGPVVAFQNFAYDPKCLKVKVGQPVTFQGDFSVHPLRQSCGPAPVLTGGTGTQSTFTFSVAGFYGYYCLDHGSSTGQAMAGAILVVP